MMYEVVVCNQARTFLKKIENNKLKTQILNILKSLQINPIPFKECDTARIKGRKWMFRIRLGDYRIIYGLDKAEKKVNVFWIGTRGNAYKKI